MDFFSFAPIPKPFHSFELDEPFTKCFMCECDLMEDGTNYIIEKAYKKTEVIFEYAMCWDCREKLMNELSKQSRKLIDNYFEEHIDIEARAEKMLELHGENVEGWISHCIIKGTPVEQSESYQIYAQCVDRDILFAGMPYAISSEAVDDLIKLLSDESLGVIGDFSKKLFDLDVPNPSILI